MVALDVIAPLLEMFQDQKMQDKAMETARLLFTGTGISVNLIPSIVIFGLLGLITKAFGPILLSLLGGLGGDSGGASYGSELQISDAYGAPDAGYGAPDAGYGAPASGGGGFNGGSAGYDAPGTGGGGGAGYDAPSGGGAVGGARPPSGGYDAPSSGYSAGRKKRTVSLTDEQKTLYSDLIAPNLASSQTSDYVLSHRSLPVEQPVVVAEAVPLLQ